MKSRSAKRLQLDVGRRVAELRAQQGLTQEKLAERLRKSVRYLQDVEAGRENLTIQSMAKIARKIGLDAEEFFEVPASRKRQRRGRPPRR